MKKKEENKDLSMTALQAVKSILSQDSQGEFEGIAFDEAGKIADRMDEVVMDAIEKELFKIREQCTCGNFYIEGLDHNCAQQEAS